MAIIILYIVLLSNRGESILAVVISSLIVIVGVVWFFQSQATSLNRMLKTQDTLVAEFFATELLEFFRSQTPDRIKASMNANPLCAQVNRLNRSNATLTAPDPMATLPTNIRLNGSLPTTKANRYYQIKVVNMKTRAPRADLCGLTTSKITLNGRAPVAGEIASLGPDDRFVFTVGVSWVPGGKLAETKEVALTTVGPLP